MSSGVGPVVSSRRPWYCAARTLRILRLGVVFLASWGAPGLALAHQPLDLDLEWGGGPVIGDLTGTALGGYGREARFGALRGLQLDSLDAAVRLAPGLRLVGRLEVGVDGRNASRDVVMGACEVGLRFQPWKSRTARTFVSAGAGWVGGGFISPDAAGGRLVLGDHVFDPQVHLLTGLDVRLQGGWSFELRLPFRYLWGPDLPLAAATVGFRHAI